MEAIFSAIGKSASGRVDIETDDVAQFVDKLRVGGELELLHPMRLKAVRTPDALDGTRADIDDLRHHGRGPVGCLGGSVWVSITTRSVMVDPSGWMREGRVLSRSRPS